MEKNFSIVKNYSIDNNLNFENTIKTAEGTAKDNFSANYFPRMDGLNKDYSCYKYWQDYYYPRVRESYPVYIQEHAMDKGKKAFEIIKAMKDKKFIKLDTVGEFIDCMDELIKIL